ncbi:Peptidyl-prolyl cis-trans isomerase, cyclophilin-type [Rhodotorula toruloides]|nr:Peptidyl-prolyl cis-trans isomerase, cyclophilin-type [Rhodotorula toruloides]
MSFVVTEPITEGLVVLHTSLGDILIELWRRECPKAVRNFVQLCLEGHYDGVPFHRIRLKFNRRGLVAMAADPTTKSNMSQFFFTLDAAPELQNKHTLFGRVAGDSLFNLLKLQEVELEVGTDKPVFPPTIKRAEVRVDPFEDGPDPIRPRITAEERREQEKAKKEMMAERAREKKQGKRKGTKNKALLSFGADADEPEDTTLQKTKIKSAHDVLHDSRLSSQVIDDRGLSATLPPELMGGPPVPDREDKGKRRRTEDDSERRRDEKRGRTEAEPSGSVKLDEVRKLKEKAPKSEAERRKEEIAKVQAELKKMTGKSGSDDEETGKAKKAKRSGPSLLLLEREKYMRGGAKATGKGKKRANDEDDVLDALEGFRSKLFQAAKSAPQDEEEEENKPEKLHGIDLNDDELEEDTEGWMTHSLKFRKDATQDLHALDEYAVVDPLAKNSMTLDEMKNKANNRGARRYAGEEREERRGGGAGGSGSGNRYEGGRDRERGDRYGGGGRDRDDRYGGRDERERNRPEVRGDWKQARVSTTDLA